MKARTLTLLGLGAALVVAGAIGAWVNVQARTYFTDADTIRVAASEAPIRSILWQPAKPVLDGGDAAGGDGADRYEPRVSADGATMVFVRGRAGENADLYLRRRLTDGWSEPEAIPAVNTDHDELGPELSRDGQSLYFYSDRPGGLGGYDIWVSRAAQGGWGEPVNLGPAINSEFSEYGPALTPDGQKLYFASNRPRPGEPQPERSAWPATVREQRTRHDYDLYCADLGSASAAAAVLTLNTTFDEGAPSISPSGDFLYFASDRPGGLGGFDIYRSRILRGVLQRSENLGAAVNSPVNDLDPAPSVDGFRLFFSSDRAMSEGEPSGRETRYALWVSGSREVFTEAEPLRAGQLLVRIWDAVWPWLLSLLLALLMAALLYRLLRDEAMRRRFHQLSLMAKCVVVSLLIHAAILFLLAAWRVGGAIGDMLHSGGSRVVLGSSGDGGDGGLAAQVRGGFTTAEAQDARVDSPRALLATPEVSISPVMMTAAPAVLTMTPSRIAMEDHDAKAPSEPSTSEETPNTEMPRFARAPQAEPARPSVAEPQPNSGVSDISDSPRVAPVSGSVQLATVNVAPAAAPVPQAASTSAAPSESAPAASRPSPEARMTAVSQASPSDATSNRLPSAAEPEARSETAAGTAPQLADSVRAATLSPVAGAGPRVELAPASAAVPTPSGASVSTIEPAGVEPGAATPSASLAAGIQLPSETARGAGAGSSERVPDAAPGRRITESGPGAPSLASGPRATPAAQPATMGGAVSLLPAPAGPGRGASIAPTEIAASDSSSSAAMPNVHGLSALGEGVPSLGARLPNEGSAAAVAKSGSPEASSAESGLGALVGPSRRPGFTAESSGAAAVRLGPPAAILGTIPGTSAPVVSSSITDSSRGGSAIRSSIPQALPAGDALGSRLPAAEVVEAKPAETFAQRAPEVRAEVLERTGGSQETERAVGLALEWFRTHQSRDGHWSGRHFDVTCTKCSGEAEIDADAAMTGMTLLCYLGAGHTHQSQGPYRDLVKQALTWLVEREDASGDLRRGETMYSQTIAAVALCEAYAMTRDPWLERPARLAVTLVARGAARRDVQTSASDTSILGWQIMAIKSAQRAGFDVPTTAFDDARRWLDRVAAPNSPGRYAYRPGDRPSAAATAEAMFVQQLLGHSRDEPRMREAAGFVMDTPPAWRREAPTHYWYYATLALFQQQGEWWKDWNEALARELLAHQHQEPGLRGSWDPHDEWSQLGGRVYQTAICTLSLEVYYRYRLAEDKPR